MAAFDIKKLILYILYLPGKDGKINEPIEGVTRFQKAIFLFEKEILPKLKLKKKEDFEEIKFFAYKFGPYSSEVFDSIRFFIAAGFIDEVKTFDDKPVSELAEEAEFDYDTDFTMEDISSSDTKSIKYKLSDKGIRYVNKNLIDLFSSEQRIIVENFKAKINSMPLNAILHYVYTNYPEMTVNSTIKDRFL